MFVEGFIRVLGEGFAMLITVAIFAVLCALAVHFWHRKSKFNAVSSFDMIKSDNNSFKEEDYVNLDMKSFDDIAGLSDLKDELRKFLNVFRNSNVYKDNSVEVPRGILLWGPPGCGKTSLAKAIAKEAGVNFLCRNASDLMNKDRFLSDGSGITHLFEVARRNSPCIIFIDELDIIGSRFITGGMAGSHQIEVTKLLAELDGFQKNEGILVIGATNNIGSLDTALLRSGRFSKKFYVSKPVSYTDILNVINMYKGNKPFDSSITDDDLVRCLGDLTPADIKDLLNECGVYAVQNNSCITLDLINKTILELDLKTNLVSAESLEHSEKMKNLLAVHEVGHAIVGKAIGFTITQVSINGTQTGVGGFTKVSFDREGEVQTPSNSTMTIKQLLGNIILAFGGVEAELLCNNNNILDVSVGCSGDLDSIHNCILNIGSIYTYDFTHIGGMLNPKHNFKESDLLSLRNVCESITHEILVNNIELHSKLVSILSMENVISGSEFNELCKGIKYFDINIDDLRRRLKNELDMGEYSDQVQRGMAVS